MVSAKDYRSDLCTSIGSCNHSYSFTTPSSFKDDKVHTVYAYGIDEDGVALHNSALLGYPNSAVTFQCSATSAASSDPYASLASVLAAIQAILEKMLGQ